MKNKMKSSKINFIILSRSFFVDRQKLNNYVIIYTKVSYCHEVNHL